MLQKRNRPLSLGLAAALLACGAFLADTAAADSYPYRRDMAFEDAVSAQFPNCMPPVDKRPAPELEERVRDLIESGEASAKYALRAVYHMALECGWENMEIGQAVKYGTLFTAWYLNPAMAAAYTKAELASDLAKCTGKALIETWDGPDRHQKDFLKASIDTAASLKDIYGWVKDGFDWVALSQEDGKKKVQALQKLFGVMHSSGERVADARDLFALTDIVVEYADEADEFLQFVFGDASDRYFQGVQSAYDACRYDDAALLLRQARSSAAQQCRALGARYRQIEREIRLYIESWDSPYLSSTKRDRLQTIYRYTLDPHKRTFSNRLDHFEELAQFQSSIDAGEAHFGRIRTTYDRQFDRARTGLDTPDACAAIESLDTILAPLSPDCRSSFLAGTGPGIGAPSQLYEQLNNDSRLASAARHRQLEEARSGSDDCRFGEARALLQTVRDDIGQRDLLVYADGACSEANQDELIRRVLDVQDKIDRDEARERATRQLYEQAGSQAADGKRSFRDRDVEAARSHYQSALLGFQRVRQDTLCPTTMTAADEAIAAVQRNLARVERSRAALAAIDACAFGRARQLIAEAPSGVRSWLTDVLAGREAVENDVGGLYAEADQLNRRGNQLRSAGDPDQARQSYVAARARFLLALDRTGCDSHRQAIGEALRVVDRNLARLGDGQPAASPDVGPCEATRKQSLHDRINAVAKAWYDAWCVPNMWSGCAIEPKGQADGLRGALDAARTGAQCSWVMQIMECKHPCVTTHYTNPADRTACYQQCDRALPWPEG